MGQILYFYLICSYLYNNTDILNYYSMVENYITQAFYRSSTYSYLDHRSYNLVTSRTRNWITVDFFTVFESTMQKIVYVVRFNCISKTYTDQYLVFYGCDLYTFGRYSENYFSSCS